MLTTVDQDFVGELLDHVSAGEETPFATVEVRQFGARAGTDVPGVSSVGGRSGGYNFFALGVDPSFEHELPDAFDSLLSDLRPWVSDEENINFAAHITTDDQFRANWPPSIFDRFMQVRAKYDPDRFFAYGPTDR